MNLKLNKIFKVVARLILVVIGIGLSLYALHVKESKNEDDSYTAHCDISEKISCSAIFTSKWGRGFGILEYIVGEDHILNQSNSFYGILFFGVQILGCFSEKYARLLFYMTSLGILSCIYLAIILYFVLEDFCVVCVSTYFVTVSLHLLNYLSCNSNTKRKQN